MQSTDPLTPITQAEADSLFSYELLHTADGVANALEIPLSQQQFDALVDFAYNCGVGALASSTLLTAVNGSDFAGAATEFGKWNKARDPASGLLIVSPGLTKRRAAEVAIFLNADYSGKP